MSDPLAGKRIYLPLSDELTQTGLKIYTEGDYLVIDFNQLKRPPLVVMNGRWFWDKDKILEVLNSDPNP